MKSNLNGYGKQFKGSYNDEPTEKQKNIILKLRLYYGKDKIPYCKTKKEAWDCIKYYEDVIKYDKNKNEFYIEDNKVEYNKNDNNLTMYTIVSDKELECIKLVNQLRSVLKGDELNDFENLIKEIGDFDIICEVTKIMIKQQQKAAYENLMRRHNERKRPIYRLPDCDGGYEPGVDPDADADRLLE